MPTCKVSRSTTRRRRYRGGASSGEMYMREALDFFFVTVTKQYNRENPSKKIAPPTSEEFLAYASALSAKAMEDKKSVGGSGKYRKLRRVKSRRIVGGGILDTLIYYIFGPTETLCDKLFTSLGVVLLSVWLAALTAKTTLLMSSGSEFYPALMAANADPDVANSIGDPLRWGCSQVMPKGLEYYDALFVGMNDFINRGLGAVPEAEVSGVSIIYVGLAISKILNLMTNSYLYKKAIVMPGALFLHSVVGIPSCKKTYDEAVAKELVPITAIYDGLSGALAVNVIGNVNVLGGL